MLLFEHEILTPNEKIRKIRKFLNIKQDVLVIGSSISREMVSHIENNKNNLSTQNAEIFSKNINKVIIERHLNLEFITPEYLLEDLNSAAERIIKLNIKKIKELPLHKDSDEQLTLVKKTIENLLNSYEINEATIYNYYDSLNDYFYQKHEYDDCNMYLFKCFEIAAKEQNNEHIINFYTKKIRVYNNKKRFQQSIETGIYAIEFAKMHNIEKELYLKPIYFNVAKAYRNINMCNECLVWIKYLEDYYKVNEKELMDIMTIKANCFFSINNFEESLKVNEIILDLAIKNSDANRIAVAYGNISEIYLKLNYYDKADEAIHQAISIDSKLEDEYMFYIYKFAHEISIKLQRTLMVIEGYFKKAFLYGMKIHDESSVFDLIMYMIDYCFENKYYECMENLILNTHEDILINKYKECNLSRFYCFTSFYMKTIDIEIAEQLQRQGIELIRNTI